MPVVNAVNIGVLVEDTGEAPRTLQHWSDLGILRPLPATDKRGRGYYREFAAEPYHGERAWALVASALSKLRIPLGDLRRIVDTLRPMLTLEGHRNRPTIVDDKAAEHRFKASPLYQALTTENDVLLLAKVDLASPGEDSTGVFLQFSPAITPEMLQPLESGFFARSPSAEEIITLQIAFTRDHGGQAHLLNLTRIFRPLRA